MPTVPERLPFRTAYQLGSFYQLTDSIQWPTRQGLWLSLTGFFSSVGYNL